MIYPFLPPVLLPPLLQLIIIVGEFGFPVLTYSLRITNWRSQDIQKINEKKKLAGY
jgi:hypothetical protein